MDSAPQANAHDPNVVADQNPTPRQLKGRGSHQAARLIVHRAFHVDQEKCREALLVLLRTPRQTGES
jgi:hypothetical protein